VKLHVILKNERLQKTLKNGVHLLDLVKLWGTTLENYGEQ
jgi:hypothetical protein